jgi:hypothetical protein
MQECRYFAHRVDGQIFRGFQRGAVIEDFDLVRLAGFFQHPAGGAAARHRVGV